MKRSLLALAAAGALALVLAGGTFFALKLTASGAVVGPVSMTSIPGNPPSGVSGQAMLFDCNGGTIPCPVPLTLGVTGPSPFNPALAPVTGITAWDYPAMNPPAHVALAYYGANDCDLTANVATLVSDPLGPVAADIRVHDSATKTGILITPANAPYVSGTAGVASVAVVSVGGDFQCGDNVDSDGDGDINDGCSEVTGSAVDLTDCATASCPDADGERPWDNCDGDADGAINDGCPANGSAEVVVILDPPNNQYLACGNVDGSAVTGWDGLLGADWKLLLPTAEIDADVTNGTGPCNPVDATTDVEIGDSNDIAVCLTNLMAPEGDPPTNGVAKIQFDVLYNDALNSCDDEFCDPGTTGSKCLDDMPDLNDGDSLGMGVPTDPDIGGGWDCSGFGTTEPSCTGGVASIACGTLNGPFPPTGSGISFPIFAVTFTANAVGIDTLSLANAAVYDKPGNALGSCNPTLFGEPELLCIGAEIDKHIPWTPTPLPPSCDLSVVKTDLPDPVIVGNDVVYTITVTNNDPVVVEALDAEDVVLVDTLPAEKVYVVDSATCDQGTCSEAGNVVTCDIGTIAVDASVVCTISATATTLGTHINVVDVTTSTADANAANNHDEESTSEVSSGVRMLKLLPGEGEVSSGILWLMDPALECVNADEGKGCLTLEKWVFNAIDEDSPNDLDTDHEGLGAWEEQIKYDHKIVRLNAEPDTTWLESGGRIAICSTTILTENWMLTGCVTKDDDAEPGMQLGPEGDGLLETITVVPVTDDLIYRQGFRPTKDNGIITDIVDENCEVADILGEQMPGTLPGGMTPVCGDAHILVRMLEGDLNLDCTVDVLDDQEIAFRYGSFFGLALYDEWYDLAPECITYACDANDDGDVLDADDVCTECTLGVPDFDIDIKDLQFVFGRNYSTCQEPIPDGQSVMPDLPQP